MDYPKYFNPKNSLKLFGLEENFNFLSSIYSKDKLPKVLMLSGLKGTGKSTLINHLLFSIFDSQNYNKSNHSLSDTSVFYKKFREGIFQNILYVKGSDFRSLKIEDIRNLKSVIQQSSMINSDRFIVLDDIELFNVNSLNALLKIIEEPSKKNYFILINNKTKPILDTIKSRSLELKSNSGLGLGTFLGKTLLERQNAKVLFKDDKNLGGASVVISWSPKNILL